jgi:uncharacterized protein
MENVDTNLLCAQGDAAEESGDIERARRLFEQGAALNDSTCLMRLALIYDLGLGVPVNQPRALRLNLRAWRQGAAVAAINIATIYRDAGREDRAADWYRRGAGAGDGEAAVELARRYLEGCGVARSPSDARKWLQFAIENQAWMSESGVEEAKALLERLRPASIG